MTAKNAVVILHPINKNLVLWITQLLQLNILH